MNDPKEIMPFIIPVMILEICLLVYTIRHILKHDTYKHGNRALWLVVTIVGMQFIGPILYFIFGRNDD